MIAAESTVPPEEERGISISNLIKWGSRQNAGNAGGLQVTFLSASHGPNPRIYRKDESSGDGEV